MSDAIIASLRTLGGRYEIGELLGRGGMAQVHLGRDIRLERKVAIKLLKPELSADPDFRTRFRQEAQAAARMSHPTVVRVYDAGEEVVTVNGTQAAVPYIVMEYVDGRMVKDIIAEGPLSESEAVRITKGVLTALEYSHRAGIVHRDIKPGNVMVTPAGQIKVMDFGIARAVSETSASISQTGAILGTAQYFSPEQARGEVVDARTDLYSAGVMLFEMLTGKAPFRGDTAVAVAYQHVSEQPPTPSSITPGITPAMDSVVLKSLAKQKDQRFQTAAEFREALDAALLGAPVTDGEDESVAKAGAPTGAATTMFAALGSESDEDELQQQAPTRRLPVAWIWGGVALLGVLVAAVVVWAVNLGPGLPLAGLSATVPDVVNMQFEEANKQISDAGLSADVRQIVDDSEPGTVIRTDPGAGTNVSPESPVTVYVSNGPAPSALVNVANLSVAQATSALEAAHLTVGSTTSENSATVAEGQVIRTDPAAGTPASWGDAIDLVVSNGLVTIPDVVGQNYRTAIGTLEGADVGYQVQLLIRNSCYNGNVLEQSLTPGDHPQKGTITITYCGGTPPPPPEPEPTATPEPEPTPQPSEGDDNGADPQPTERGDEG